MRHRLMTMGMIAGMVVMFSAIVSAHCQVPCGIYNDSLRFTMLREHIATIEKSMNEITSLSAAAEKNYNQIVRWVTNKDDHAQQFQDIVTFYFLAQRIKPVDAADAGHADYVSKLELLHRMHVTAMLCKQTTDPANVEKLKTLVDDFEKAYFGK